jgi:pyruvate dehydrogenase E2 component (dihydrolipoamide acetyltransferase)
MMPSRRSVRRKLAVASWRAPSDGRIYTRAEIDATAMLAHARSLSESTGVHVTVTHVIGKAVAAALAALPAVNARVVLGRVVGHPRVDVAFAVDIADGDDLGAVTLRGVDAMSTVEIARGVASAAQRLRTGRDPSFARSTAWIRVAPRPFIRPALAFASLWSGGLGRPGFGQPGFPFGGAFISNVGGLGLDEALLAPLPFARCPLYLCIGAIRERPVAADGVVTVRPVMVITATADHRIIDGVQAARFAGLVRDWLADPARLDATNG